MQQDLSLGNKSSIIEIPESNMMDFNVNIQEINYNANPTYALQNIKNFHIMEHVQRKNSNQIISDPNVNELLSLFIVLFVHEAKTNINLWIKLSQVVYKMDVQVPKGWPSGLVYWNTESQVTEAVRSTYAKICSRAKNYTLQQWLDFFANYQLVLYTFILIFLNILKDLRPLIELEHHKINQQDIKFLQDYFSLSTSKLSIHHLDNQYTLEQRNHKLELELEPKTTGRAEFQTPRIEFEAERQQTDKQLIKKSQQILPPDQNYCCNII